MLVCQVARRVGCRRKVERLCRSKGREGWKRHESGMQPLSEGSAHPEPHPHQLPGGPGAPWSSEPQPAPAHRNRDYRASLNEKDSIDRNAGGSSSSSSGPSTSQYRPLVLGNLIKSISVPLSRAAASQDKLFAGEVDDSIENWRVSGLVSAIYVCLQTGNIDRALAILKNKRKAMQLQENQIRMDLQAGSISRQVAQQRFKDSRAINFELHDIRIHNAFLEAFVESMDKVPGQGRWEACVDYYKHLETYWKSNSNDTTMAIMLRGCMKQEKMGIETSEPPELVALNVLKEVALRAGNHDFPKRLAQLLQDPYLNREQDGARQVAYMIKRAIVRGGPKPLKLSGPGVSREHIQSVLDSFLTGSTPSTEEAFQVDQIQSLAQTVPPVKSVSKPATSPSKSASTDDQVFGLTLLQGQLSEMIQATSHGLTPIERQRQLESKAYDSGRARLQHAHESEIARTGKQSMAIIQRRSVQSLMWQWHLDLEDEIRKNLADLVIKQGLKKAQNQLYSPISDALAIMAPEKLSNLTISEMIYLTGTDTGSANIPLGIKTARALLAVGKAVEQEHRTELMAKAPKNERDRIERLDIKANAMYSSGKIYDAAARAGLRAEQQENEAANWLPKWSDPDRARVGSLLVGMLLDTAKVRQYETDPETGKEIYQDMPAFHHTYQYIQGKRQGLIKLHSAVSEQLARGPLSSTIQPRLLPMLVLPRPWINYNSGGYHFTKQSMMRTKFCPEQLHYLREASNQNALNIIFNGLDVLGSTAWMVNRDMFEVVLEAWNMGIEIGKLPAKDYQGPVPVKPDDLADQAGRAKYQNQLLEHYKIVREIHSQRCDVNYKLEIARAFLGEVMYFPHSLDFRGRAYPIPPNFNHMGNDLCRGLLLFAESKPLGEAGLRWLKVHLAGKFGYDKAMFAEREKWTDEHMAEIEDSADQPLTGRRWWVNGDDPWQTLAACKELVKALRSPAPTEYRSQLPLHQDGTCNGLQHYAALGGDAAGARQVNLMPGDRPADVYSGVADIVRADIVKDADAGLEIAKILQDKITRKVVKQTIMTTVYGVTFIGAKEQICGQLKDRGDIPPEKLFEAGNYLAKKVLRSIGTEFRGASAIQVWLTESARLIAKSVAPERIKHLEQGLEPIEHRDRRRKAKPQTFLGQVREEQMTAVIWTNPVGLTCVQPYRREVKHQITTSLQTIFIQDPNVAMPVDPQRQASAFPPNFIHSLDASHMFLTAIECKARDLTFASVHDSYWTHACDIDSMSELIRDTFTKLHTAKILESLRKEFLERYKDHKIAVISVGARGNNHSHISSKGGLHSVSQEKLDQLNGIEMSPDEVRMAAEKAVKDTKKKRTALQSAEIDFKDVDGPLDTTSVGEGTEANGAGTLLEADTNEALTMTTSRVEQRDSIHNSVLQHARGKWVNLVDVIPELPERGKFDVEMIKRSLYFFS